jgi:hypothetical protein
MKRFTAAVLTVALMGLLLWSGLRRGPSTTSSSTSTSVASSSRTDEGGPVEAAIRALLESGRRGDVAAYLGAFTGALHNRLAREVDERGREAFADDLCRAARARKSHAVFAVEPEGSSWARVTVESVYADRNERQTYRMEQTEGVWRVSEVESVRSHQPRARFGAPAVYIAPEGVPVQGGLVVETGDEDGAPRTPKP